MSACGISILSEQAQNHRSLIPYLEFQQGINRLVSVPRSKYLSWDVLLGLRSYCQLRIGALSLSNRGRCIFCGVGARNPTVHVLGSCRQWTDQRLSFQSACRENFPSPDSLTYKFLRLGIEDAGFAEALLWIDKISLHAAATLTKNACVLVA